MLRGKAKAHNAMWVLVGPILEGVLKRALLILFDFALRRDGKICESVS